MRPFRLLLIFIPLIISCTSNPFWDDSTSSGYRSVRGHVQLYDGSNPGGVYVWLQGFDSGTFTNSSGEFNLELPAPGSQAGGTGQNGMFTLYAYAANYFLEKADVVLRDGEVLSNKGDVAGGGRLGAPLLMRRFLRIITEMEPASVIVSRAEPVTVNVRLVAPSDSVSVILPGSFGGMLGAVLLRCRETGEVTGIPFSQTMGGKARVVVGSNQATQVSMSFSMIYYPLIPGRYEAIPFLFVSHEAIPDGLIESLGSGVTNLNKNYLKIPFKREGGNFEVRTR